MDTRMHDSTDVTPRRGFFTRIAAGAMALGLTGLASAPARAAAGAEDGPDWPGTLKGRHRQVVDAYAPNDGSPLAFAFTFVVTNGPASADLVPATAVVVLRHTAFPFALDHPMWQKYDPCLWMTMGSMLRLGLAGAAAKESAMLRSMPREDRMDTRMHEKIILR